MTDMIKIFYILFLLGFLYYLTIRIFILKDPFKKKEWYITLIVLGLSLVFYVRFIIHDLIITDPSDEAMYVTLAEEVSRGLTPPISGPGFVYIILLFNSISGWPLDNVTALMGILISGLLLPFIYILYKENGGSREIAAYSCLILIVTSYFLWPYIESRPQQFGLLLVFAGAFFYNFYLTKGKYLVLFIMVGVFTFFFHILSFLVLISLVSCLWWFRYVEGRSYFRQMFWPAILIGSGLLIFFSPLQMYSHMNGGVKWMFKMSELGFLRRGPVILILFALGISALIVVTYFFRKKRVIERIRNLDKRHLNKFVPFFVSIIVLALVVQFFLDMDVHRSKYRDSFILFMVFQIGNILFGAFFVRSYCRYIRENDLDDPYFRSVTILMLIGLASLIVSIFLPMNFNNWSIRMINYWTVFAAPIIARDIMDLSPGWRKTLAFALPVLIVLSLINISRDQTIFGYP